MSKEIWVAVSEKLPNLNDNGQKVLIYRIMNDSQSSLAISIHETNMVKYCNPNETWWMELPKPPSINKITDSVEIYLPTIQEVIMWLYEKHGIFVTVNIPYEEFGKFSAEIQGEKNGNKILLVDGMSVFDSLEKAYEEGITESLKLIKP
jgi:hypothetical protein